MKSMIALLLALGWMAIAQADVRVVQASDSTRAKLCQQDKDLCRLLNQALPSIGIPYVWGGTQLTKGIDCSNFTWQLHRSAGRGYERFLSTQTLARIKNRNGLRQVSFQQSKPGDLLVYGYQDGKTWRGHVVILMDRDGKTTGHKGLVLGSHGGPVRSVQFVTYDGFDKGYFGRPEMKLRNVLRVDKSAPE